MGVLGFQGGIQTQNAPTTLPYPYTTNGMTVLEGQECGDALNLCWLKNATRSPTPCTTLFLLQLPSLSGLVVVKEKSATNRIL
mmetsp:Transcript_140543/g.244671  ORF Transcript_140543/g.244671 Transcript_140543/m.244671 type:complete len:83 (+) Transcript_140543:164-412(+)